MARKPPALSRPQHAAGRPAKASAKLRKPRRVYGGQAHAARVGERRQRFIEAGIRQFGSVGYHATTMRSLCAEAGLSNRYFYESFSSIEALLIASYAQLMDQLRERIVAAISTAPSAPQELARSGAQCFFEAVRDPLFARIAFQEVLGVSPAVDQAYLACTRSYAQVLIAVARRMNVTPALSAAELEMLGIMAIGGFAYAATHWMHSGYALPLETLVEVGVRQLMQLAASLEPGKAPAA